MIRIPLRTLVIAAGGLLAAQAYAGTPCSVNADCDSPYEVCDPMAGECEPSRWYMDAVGTLPRDTWRVVEELMESRLEYMQRVLDCERSNEFLRRASNQVETWDTDEPNSGPQGDIEVPHKDYTITLPPENWTVLAFPEEHVIRECRCTGCCWAGYAHENQREGTGECTDRNGEPVSFECRTIHVPARFGEWEIQE